jgi:pyruvate/2-oxoglutarate dehydrogenase complex dihydrolipoamide dehydrogenase (E3) component
LAHEDFAVILGTGAKAAVPRVERVDLPHVVQDTDLLWDPSIADQAQQVLIVGGGSVG